MSGGDGAWLQRPGLERHLDAALAHRLTTLVAAPGYGKSALLERWAAGVAAVGHRLTSDDRRMVHLASRVTAALRLRAPGLANELTDVLSADLGPDGAAEAGARAAALAGTLSEALAEALRRDLVLVLDDVDVLEPTDASARFVDGLLRSAPHRLHLVTASRGPAPFPVARLREQGQVLELTATELTLTRDEVRAWTAALLGEASDELADEVLELSGGWPLAAVTTLHELAGHPPGQRRPRLHALGPVPMVEEMVLDVLDAQPEPAAELLRLGTLTPLLTVELADALGYPGEALAAIQRTGSLLDAEVAEPDAYRLTPTAGAAIERHRPLDPEVAAGLAADAARVLAGRGRADLALRTLLRVEAPETLAGLLTDHADLLEGPDTADDVLAALDALPADVAAGSHLRRLAGIAHQARGDWERAREVLTEVAATEAFDATVGWRLGLVHHLRGELDEALRVYERGAAGSWPPADAAICRAWAASARWLRGERDACAELADEAMVRATELDDPRALAAAHMVLAMLAALDGDRRTNDAHYLRATEHAERAGDVLQLIRIRSNRASHHLEEGAYTDALAELEVARRLADLTGFTPFGALTLSNRAEALVGVGRLEEAALDAADAVEAWRSLGSRLVLYGLEGRARVQRLRGDARGAVATYREALAEAEGSDEVQGMVPSLASLAELLVHDEPDEARALVARALAFGEGMGYVAARLAAARVALATGGRAEARGHVERAEEAATARRDRPGLARVAELRAVLDRDPDRADEAIERWGEIGDVMRRAGAELTRAELVSGDAGAEVAEAVRVRMHELGCRMHDDRIHALRSAAAPDGPPPVTVETLGAFRVLRSGVPVARTAWQSRKARGLVKLLASRRGRPVARDWLVEQLWPDVDAATGAKRLNVMTSTVRGILDPDKGWDSDHLLASDRDTLQLDLRHLELDVDAFLRDVDAATALDREGRDGEAMARWQRAERRYRGDFCEDEVYADWAVGLREEARAAYGQTVARLAGAATAAGRHDEAVRLWLRLLERDPYDERAHLALVAAMQAAGRPGDARRRYLTYVERAHELGVEPASFPGTTGT